MHAYLKFCMKTLESRDLIPYVDVFPFQTGSQGDNVLTEQPIAFKMHHTPCSNLNNRTAASGTNCGGFLTRTLM